jgi:hypothetical protein
MALTPKLESYFASLKPSAVASLPASVATRSASEKVLQARRDLLTASLLKRETGAALGLAITDTQVTPGQTVRYELYTVSASGRESPQPVAVLESFVVGQDSGPQPPTGLSAIQLSAGEVGLRWNRLTESQEEALGGVSYHLTRDNKPLNTLPILIADIERPDGQGLVEPLFFYSDLEAPERPTTTRYSLTARDIFGRESAAATLEVPLADLRVPEPPPLASAGPAESMPTRRVGVYWTETPVMPELRYRILRRDIERPNLPPQLLTSTPIEGETNLFPSLSQTQAQLRLIQTFYGEARTTELRKSPRELTRVAAQVSRARRFWDTTALPDRRYSYQVIAVLPSNAAESDPAETRTVDVPDETPPPAPTIVRASFAKSAAPAVSMAPRDYRQALNALTYDSSTKPRKVAEISATLLKLLPRDEGGVVTLTWDRPAGTPPGTLYRISRALVKAGDERVTALKNWRYLVRGQVSDLTTFSDTVPRLRTARYFYQVRTFNRWGIEQPNAMGAFINTPATLPPTTPSLLRVTPDTQGKITLEVRKHSPEDDVLRYRVYRRAEDRQMLFRPLFQEFLKSTTTSTPGEALTLPQGQGQMQRYSGVVQTMTRITRDGFVEVPMAEVSQDATRIVFRDDSPLPSKRLFYQVVAESRIGILSAPSEPLGTEPIVLTAQPPRNLIAQAEESGIRLRWSAPTDAVGYVVTRHEGSKSIELSGRLTTTTYLDTTPRPGRIYRYSIRALDSSGNLSRPVEISSSLPPS